MVTTEHRLEAVLFYAGEALSIEQLSKLLKVSPQGVVEASHLLGQSLAQRGIRVLTVGDKLELVTSPEVSEVIAELRNEELSRDLGKAGAETLATVLYRGPLSKTDIEYVRGVNCAYILRNLQIRGLIERIKNPHNPRSILYGPTPQLLKHLGITSVRELPEYEAIARDVADLQATDEGNEKPLDETKPSKAS